MKPALILLTFLLLLSLSLNAQNNIFEKISNRTWFDETGFEGESIVFIKSDIGKLQAIKQVNGSGLPALLTQIMNVDIKNDTIYLSSWLNHQTKENLKTSFYIYREQEGLFLSGRKLKILYDTPLIFVRSAGGQTLNTPLNLKNGTKILFKQNEIHINDKVFKINID